MTLPVYRQQPAGTLPSVLRNLNRLLNSRRGHAPAQLDLGIPLPSEIAYNFPDSIESVQTSLSACIGKYEPRLINVKVDYLSSDDTQLALRFQISAQLRDGDDFRPVQFAATVGTQGQVDVR